MKVRGTGASPPHALDLPALYGMAIFAKVGRFIQRCNGECAGDLAELGKRDSVSFVIVFSF